MQALLLALERGMCMQLIWRGFGNHDGTVADPEGVPWVLWNPSFEGLPSKILCANVLRTLPSHWNYALQLHSSNNARMSPHSCIKYLIRTWPTCRYKWAKRASEL